MDLPTTLTGWLGTILTILLISGIILGVMTRWAKIHIDSRINHTLASTVRKAVIDGMKPVDVRLEAMQLQLVTQGVELVRVSDRVAALEMMINNGLEKRLERIEIQVDRIVDRRTERQL